MMSYFKTHFPFSKSTNTNNTESYGYSRKQMNSELLTWKGFKEAIQVKLEDLRKQDLRVAQPSKNDPDFLRKYQEYLEEKHSLGKLQEQIKKATTVIDGYYVPIGLETAFKIAQQKNATYLVIPENCGHFGLTKQAFWKLLGGSSTLAIPKRGKPKEEQRIEKKEKVCIKPYISVPKMQLKEAVLTEKEKQNLLKNMPPKVVPVQPVRRKKVL